MTIIITIKVIPRRGTNITTLIHHYNSLIIDPLILPHLKGQTLIIRKFGQQNLLELMTPRSCYMLASALHKPDEPGKARLLVTAMEGTLEEGLYTIVDAALDFNVDLESVEVNDT
ncbi:hypothetical protein QKD27_gp2 [Wenling tonguesole paramyxovirus]|uniref:Uncharacterized protein n=1 Tax=Wenling tonguesole paramyxovirus TaxID=2116454 RepID=A0A2P1GN06_9MONO|nr:hypothetical protein QKD27_gp2 [Wenling tonguesole paramyxovirus]AVM87371.1 hypothetical protein [Wenling tonguesole paramyxovirus]